MALQTGRITTIKPRKHYMRSQRGFMLYAAIGAAAVIGALGVALMIQGARLDSAKAKLQTCQTAYETALESIKRQNEAVQAHAEAVKKATERARIASAAAAKAKVATASERKRIAALIASGSPKGDCPAGKAVAEARKGLK